VIRVCVLTISEKGSKGQRNDTSGPAILEMLKEIQCSIEHQEVLPDNMELIKETLIRLSKSSDLILTTGGTGLSPDDVTPEATLEAIQRRIDGIPEAMRAAGLKKTNRAMLSRAVAGVRDETLIINLPGSPKAIREGLEAIIDVIPHAVEKIKGSQEECAR
jgi:molybdenum cofactor synthesis domain-containing protein